MTEITLSGIEEFVQTVCQLNNNINSPQQLWAQELLFRGQSNKAYELLPGITLGDFFSTPEFNALEQEIK